MLQKESVFEELGGFFLHGTASGEQMSTLRSIFPYICVPLCCLATCSYNVPPLRNTNIKTGPCKQACDGPVTQRRFVWFTSSELPSNLLKVCVS